MIVAGNGIYELCNDCGHYVKMNKWLFGSAHFCITPEERLARANAHQTRAQMLPKQASPLLGGLYFTKEAEEVCRYQQDATAKYYAAMNAQSSPYRNIKELS